VFESVHLSVVQCDEPFEILRGSAVRQRFAPHVHETFAIGAIEGGVARSRSRGADHVHRRGDVILIEPGEVHTGEPVGPNGWSYRMLYLPCRLVARWATLDGEVPGFARSAAFDPELAGRIVQVHEALERPGDALRKSTALAEVLHDLVDRHGTRTTHDRTPHEASGVRRVRDYLHAHPSAPVTIADLARIAQGSPFHLIRQFRRRYGVPPHRYLVLLRVERAKAMLRRGMPIAEAACAAGFSDQAHLTRQFKAVVGVPPGRYATARGAGPRRADGAGRRGGS
jgi:AraC-like DNA-binding protein